MTKLQRCIRLFSAFQRMGTLATRDVMRILDVDRQTAVRDVKSLIESQVPIEVVGEGRERRYTLSSSYRKGGVMFSQGDAFALHFGRQFLGFVEGTALTDWLDQLRQKLDVATPRLTRQREDRFVRRLVFLSEPYRPYGPRDGDLDEILCGLLDNRTLAMTYRSRRGVRTWPEVRPLAVVIYRRALYLLAQVDGPQIVRLAVDRIAAVRRGETFVYPPNFEPMVELSRTFGIFDDGREVQRVRLRFAARVADLVVERVWHPTATVTVDRDGTAVLSMQATGPELARLVLEWGDAVFVEEPAWLRHRVVDELRAALMQYPEWRERVQERFEVLVGEGSGNRRGG